MLEPSFNDLCRQLSTLRMAMRAVQVAAAGDAAMAGSAQDALAIVDDVILGAERGRNASRLPVDIDAVRRVLPRCQRRFGEFKERFYGGMNSPQRLAELGEAGAEEIVYYIGRCSGPLFASERALGACWRTVGEYSALNPGGAIPGFFPPA
jgi:hypothetical protein